MAAMKIDPDWLEDGKEIAKCPVCLMVLDQPTVGCPEGHALCRQCYVTELSQRHKCPLCQHLTDASKLQRCRPLEDFIGQLHLRCKHGPKDDEGGEEVAKLEPLLSMSTDRLREELGRRSTEGETGEHRRSDAGEGVGQWCSWRGKVCEFAGHLAESCSYEPVECPNAAAGCKESVMRKDAASHAWDTCEFRLSHCPHCSALELVRDLPGHEGRCPDAQIECPNAGCGDTVVRRSMAEHRGGCGREEVQCPCPGCEERMVRAEVEEHVETSGAVHQRIAWRRMAEMEGKVAGLDVQVAELRTKVAEQGGMIA